MAIAPARRHLFNCHSRSTMLKNWLWSVHPVFEIEDDHCACALGKECSRPGKHPRTRNGVHDVTSDLEQIRAWWGRWPNANIGVATGRNLRDHRDRF